MDSLVKKLQKFTHLSRADVEMLVRVASPRRRRIDAREDVVVEGERPEVINVIQQGWAVSYKTLEDGRRQTVAYFLPGDICALNIFILKEMDHSIGALTPLTITEIPRRGFEELMAAGPRISQALWWEGLVTNAIQREWTLNLGQRSAFERMGHLFCELYLRLEAVGLTQGMSFDFPPTQTELGEALGLSTVHVNRTLQELRGAGLVALKDKTLAILDFERLRQHAMFNPNYLHLDHEGKHLDANQG